MNYTTVQKSVKYFIFLKEFNTIIEQGCIKLVKSALNELNWDLNA